MREIKFRGKRVDNGEWVYGFYIEGPYGGRYIVPPFKREEINDFYEVIPETVGQWTGYIDRENKEVYEGDIVEGEDMRRFDSQIIRGVVEWIPPHASFSVVVRMKGNSFEWMNMEDLGGMKVLGNIYDNPELNPNQRGTNGD